MRESDANPPVKRQGAARDSTDVPAPIRIVDCWNQTGVAGDGSCSKLEAYVHCRHCPVYAQAGALILNRPTPPECRREWTEQFGSGNKPAATDKLSVVIFRVGLEWLALPTHAFQEVTEQLPVHSVPHHDRTVVLGLVNVRGELLLCVSLAGLLGLRPDAAAHRPRPHVGRLVVIAGQDDRLAFPADKVHGIHRLHPEELTHPGTLAARAAVTLTEATFGWRERIVGLLDPLSVFSALHRRLA
jgi:chemotaxis-related protein WspD